MNMIIDEEKFKNDIINLKSVILINQVDEIKADELYNFRIYYMEDKKYFDILYINIPKIKDVENIENLMKICRENMFPLIFPSDIKMYDGNLKCIAMYYGQSIDIVLESRKYKLKLLENE